MNRSKPDASFPVVPWPHAVRADGNWLAFDPGRVHIVSAVGLQHAREWLTVELAQLEVEHGARPDAPDLVIELELGPPPDSIAPADGLDPSGVPHDERHTIDVRADRVRITGPSARAVMRGVATLLQLLAAPGARLPACRIEDGPRFAWRGLSLDVVRHPFAVQEIERVIDLVARYKLNVLHLHLTDSEAWRLASTRYPRLDSVGDGVPISVGDLAGLDERAAARGVTIVREVDLPGHSAAAVRAYPELAADARAARLGYLDPAVPPARDFIEAEATEFAECSPAAFVHLGGDEPFGMPTPAYVEAVCLAVGAAHAAGKRVVAWQEAVRAGALTEADMMQFWIGSETVIDADAKKADLPPEAHHFVDEMVELFAQAPADLPLAAGSGVPVLISSSDVLYLDRRYAEPAATPEGERRRERLGFSDYPAKTLSEMHEWMPEDLVAGHDVQIAGVEAALWAETIESFDDLAFLLLPRLGSAAERAWQAVPTGWEEFAVRIAPHRAVWDRTGWGAAFELGGR